MIDVVAVRRPLARVVRIEVDLDCLYRADDDGVLASTTGGESERVPVDVHRMNIIDMFWNRSRARSPWFTGSGSASGKVLPLIVHL